MTRPTSCSRAAPLARVCSACLRVLACQTVALPHTVAESALALRAAAVKAQRPSGWSLRRGGFIRKTCAVWRLQLRRPRLTCIVRWRSRSFVLARKFSAAEIPDSALLYRRLFILCNIATGASRSTVKSAASAASACAGSRLALSSSARMSSILTEISSERLCILWKEQTDLKSRSPRPPNLEA